MNAFWLLILAAAGFVVAYHTYGRFLARRVFKINPQNRCPSQTLGDEYDFVPTRRHILMGHHFTSIAGLGPIVGPAVAVIWGWAPAILWILFGAVFFGAVHDFGSLALSLRRQGRSIGDIAAELLTPRLRLLFMIIIFLELWLLIAVFAMLIAVLFMMYPQSVIPVWSEIPIAIILGWWIYRKKGSALWPSIIAVTVMYAMVYVGGKIPLSLAGTGLEDGGVLPAWIVIVLAYAFIASLLPVQTLLQPRDYINSHQLMIAMALIALGIFVSRPEIVAPAVHFKPEGAPPMFPFLFVVIACGAISGFHCLVSSGTSSKQCANERDAQFISYGGMLLEGSLSIMVVIACTAGIGLGLMQGGETLTGISAFHGHYADWQAADGLGSKLDAFARGSANMMAGFGIPISLGLTVMAVFIVSFAATTVDTATRIQRYIVGELARAAGVPVFSRAFPATLVAVGSALALAFADGSGKGALRLWPLWGTINQLLAGLALLVLSTYLARRRQRPMVTLLPMVFMMAITSWAMVLNLKSSFGADDGLLFGIGLAVMVINLWLIAEGGAVLVSRMFSGATPAAIFRRGGPSRTDNPEPGPTGTIR